MIRFVSAALIFALACAWAGDDLIGKKADEWQAGHWWNSVPLRLDNLKGKVVLVRWWTAPDCPYCAKTAPALNKFHADYHDKGLQVLGFYHHKTQMPLDPNAVKKLSDEYGFKFPIAIDEDWKTLKSWWLEGRKTTWTSVSFLIDRRGVIRHVHAGGQYVEGDAAHTALKAKIEALLNEQQQPLR